MKWKMRNRVLLGLAGLTLISVTAWGQAQGRIYGSVSDENGNRLAGVHITVTDPTLASFKLEVDTDEEGKFSFLLVNAARPYLYRLDKEGYQSREEIVKVPFKSNTMNNFTLNSFEAAKKLAMAEGLVGEADPAAAFYNDGAAAAEEKNYELAEQKFKESIAEDPGLSVAYSALARIYVAQERYGEAAAAAETAVEIDPGDVGALSARYNAYKGTGDTEKADAAFADLQAADPEASAGPMYERGVGFYNEGKMPEAQALFEQTLEIDPEQPDSHYMLGLCLVSAGDSAGAKEHFEKFLELAPEHPEASTARDMLGYLQ